MKILVAPNAMKGSLNAFEFADAIHEGLSKAGFSLIEKLPVADGGDGTAKILANKLHAHFIECDVKDPLFRDIKCGFYLNENQLAIIEMADASGLKLLKPSEYSATATTSYGTGQLIEAAVKLGAKTILLGVGGSATVDGGMGALMALGVRFYNSKHQIEYGCGANAADVVSIEMNKATELLSGVELVVLSDVKISLLGKNGAAQVFAPQKGASLEEVNELDKNLSLFCGALFQTTGKDVSRIERGGAAGGIAAALSAMFETKLVDGASYILKSIGFFDKAKTADIIITGEGKIDQTSLKGKATGSILDFGMEIAKPVYAFCGINSISEKHNFEELISLVNDNLTEEEAMSNTYEIIALLAESLGLKLKKTHGI